MLAAINELVALSPILVGLILMVTVWFATQDSWTRIAFALAIAGSIILLYWTVLKSFCHLDDSGVTNEACEAGRYYWSLAGIPILLTLAFSARWWRSPMLWVAGGGVFLLAAVVP